MKRKIIQIDEDKCNGCGLCVPNCAEGALQVIDGKIRLISDLFCDGLGACVGHCPEGAIEIIEREAVPYDEKLTMANVVKGGPNVIKAHLVHMKEHNEMQYLKEAIEYLKENNIKNPLEEEAKKEDVKMSHSHHGHHGHGGGCPGSKAMDFRREETPKAASNTEGVRQESELKQWPVQLHLVMPTASYFKGSDVVIAADCVAFAMANFHSDILKGKSLAIACPKLDTNKEVYIEKIRTMIDEAKVNTLTVVIMEVPCCGGLASMVKTAAESATRKVPVKKILISLRGDILSEEWI